MYQLERVKTNRGKTKSTTTKLSLKHSKTHLLSLSCSPLLRLACFISTWRFSSPLSSPLSSPPPNTAVPFLKHSSRPTTSITTHLVENKRTHLQPIASASSTQNPTYPSKQTLISFLLLPHFKLEEKERKSLPILGSPGLTTKVFPNTSI